MDDFERAERHLKLQEMRVLMTVVQMGSMSKAAETLRTSQPAVSRIISGMEVALGVRLLDRTTRGVEATVYGQALLKRSLTVFDELRQAVKDIKFLADPNTGELRIGCSETMAAGPVLRAINQITRRYPGVAFQIINGGAQMLRRELVQRRVDLTISWLTEPIDDQDVTVERLFSDSIVVAAGSQNPLTKRRRLTLNQLLNESWTLPPQDNYVTAIILKGFRVRGLQPPRAMVIAQSLHLRNRLLASGRFLTAIGGFAFPPLGDSPSIKPLSVDLPEAKGNISCLTLRNRMLSPLAELFIDTFRSTIQRALRKRLV